MAISLDNVLGWRTRRKFACSLSLCGACSQHSHCRVLTPGGTMTYRSQVRIQINMSSVHSSKYILTSHALGVYSMWQNSCPFWIWHHDTCWEFTTTKRNFAYSKIKCDLGVYFPTVECDMLHSFMQSNYFICLEPVHVVLVVYSVLSSCFLNLAQYWVAKQFGIVDFDQIFASSL
jgi:hypothetical protein